ncbi:MAG: putative outer rane receptor for iron transport [Moraxellaceae bacterium]|jgi:iron complex outermembrane receptor protein|nr:putative outer rane receptor for iron transport [Moraxellaceae bacterium]
MKGRTAAFSPRSRLARALALAGSTLASAGALAVEALPTVVVTGSDPAEETRQVLAAEQALTPGGVSLLDGEENYRRQTATLADLLRYVPGVWSASSAGSEATFLSIRGSNLDAVDYDGNGVKLLQDGLPVTAADGNNHNRFVDPLAARHAVVARGANALTYGASTLGGAIDFTSPTALDSAPVELFLNAGSHGQWQGRLAASALAGDFDGLVTLEAKQREGYRALNEQQHAGIYANAGWQVGAAVQTRLYVSHIASDEEIPGLLTRAQWQADPGQAEAAAVAGDYQRNVDTWRLASRTTWTLGNDSRVTVGVSVEEQGLYHPVVQGPFFSLLIDTDQRTVGSSLRYQRRAGRHDVLAGLNVARTAVDGGNYRNSGGHAAGLRTVVENEADSAELFVMDRWQFAPQWTAVYGAQGVVGRRDVRNTDVASGTVRAPGNSYDSINPRAGLIWHATPRVEFFTNLSRLYEAPTLYQLEDEVSGSNRTLAAMRGTVLEAGTRSTQAVGDHRWRWDVALYYAQLRDEILSIDDPAAPGTSLSTNVDDTIHAGLEAQVGASFAVEGSGSHRLEPLLSLTLNHFVFDGDAIYGDNALPAAPDYALRGELLYRHANGFFAGPTFDLVGERYADFGNTYTVDDYALLGLRAGLVRKTWEVFGEIRNLGDADYIARHGVRDVAAANAALLSPGEPLSAYAGARLKF